MPVPHKRDHAMTRTRTERRGNVCVLMAFCITILVGMAAIAIDGGAIMDDVQKVQAAAGGWRAANAGILLLDPTASGSLTVVGGGTMSVAGAPLIVDSTASDAITATGGGHVTVSSDKEVDVGGSPGISGSGTITGTVK